MAPAAAPLCQEYRKAGIEEVPLSRVGLAGHGSMRKQEKPRDAAIQLTHRVRGVFVLITQLRMKGPVHMRCGLVTDET
jgi:hypothetical protein